MEKKGNVIFMINIDQMLKEAQETNNAEVYIRIGDAYMTGKEVAKDMAKAFSFYEKAMNLGALAAKEKIGVSYYKAYGVAKDCKMAKKYLQEAANQGSVPALFHLGMMCYNGDYGFLTGKGKAFEFFLKAAKKGHPEAQYNIASSYMDDKWGEEKSFEKAAFWFMCAYQNRKSNKSTIDDSKKYLDYLSKYVNLNNVKEKIVRKNPEYLNL